MFFRKKKRQTRSDPEETMKRFKKDEFDTEETVLTGVPELQSGQTTEEISAFLITVAGRNVGKMYQLSEGGNFRIGRTGDLELLLDDRTVSRVHSTILKKGERVLISFCRETTKTCPEHGEANAKDLFALR